MTSRSRSLLKLLCVMAALAVGCQSSTTPDATGVPDATPADDRVVEEAAPAEAPAEPVDPATVVTSVKTLPAAADGPFVMPPALVRTADEGAPEVTTEGATSSTHDARSDQLPSETAGADSGRIQLLAEGDTPPATFSFLTGTSAATRIAIGGINADTQLAASSTHICLTARDAIACYTKGGRLVLGPMTGEAFFAATGLSFVDREIFDMRAAYDHYRNRFVIVGIYKARAPAPSPDARFVVAMSRSQDPRGGFNHYSMLATSNPDFRDWHGLDYPYVGIGPRAVMIAGTLEVNGPHCDTKRAVDPPNPCVPWANEFTVVHMLGGAAMAAGDRLHSDDSTYWQFWDFTNSDGNTVTGGLMPIVHETSTSREYILNRVGTNKVDVWAVNDPFGANQALTRRTVTLAAFTAPVNGRQSPNGAGTPRIILNNIGTDVLMGQFRSNEIVFTANDARNWDGAGTRSSVRLVELDVSQFATATPVVRKDRAFGARAAGETVYSDYGFGAAMQNENGDIAIGSFRTNSTIFPQARLNAWLSTDSDIRPSILMSSGFATLLGFGGNVGVDNSGASVDPFDDEGIYLAQPVPSSIAGAASGSCGYTSPDGCNHLPAGTACPCNNFRIAVAKMFGVTRPDAVYTSISSSSGSPLRGAAITVTLRIENEGDTTLPATNGRILLSTNDFISSSDTQIGTFSTASLSASAGRNVSVSATIPAGLATGRWFLGAQLDSGAVSAEYSESNNTNPPALTQPSITVR